jgi:hypothetical protein
MMDAIIFMSLHWYFTVQNSDIPLPMLGLKIFWKSGSHINILAAKKKRITILQHLTMAMSSTVLQVLNA